MKIIQKKGSMKIYFVMNVYENLTYVNINYMCFCL